MAQTTIEYAHLVDFTEEYGTWTGDESEAVSAGVELLGASKLSSGEYLYLAEETDEAYVVTREEVAELGAATLDGARDVYSLWCTHTGREATVEEIRETYDIEVGDVTEEFTTDDHDPDDLCACVSVQVAVAGTWHSVSTMIGVPEWLHGTVRAAGCGVRPHCTAWWSDSSDHAGLPQWAVEAVRSALYGEALRLWRDVVALRARAAEVAS